MSISFLVIPICIYFSSISFASSIHTFELEVRQTPESIYFSKLRVGVQNPDGLIKGDILYFHGFSDRLDNHGPLFESWTKQGFRVISFDYPSHGETSGTSLNLFTFRRLADLALEVERATREDINRPLILSGWSTGGLLALRIVQGQTFKKFERDLKGLILFAPGVSVRNFVGSPSLRYPIGEITLESLTHDPKPPHFGNIFPKSPGSTLLFSTFLKVNSILSQYQKLPMDLPILIFVAGTEDDLYANSKTVLNWIEWQKQNGAKIQSIEMPGSRHEIDNETEEFGGPRSRQISADFAQGLVQPLHTDCATVLNLEINGVENGRK